MPALTYRNLRGDLTDIPSVPASEAKNRLGALLDEVARLGAMAIVRHDRPRAVLLSIEEFQSLAATRNTSLATLTSEFDGLLAAMQAPTHRRGVAKAFAATPAELGRIAAKAAPAAGKAPARKKPR